MIRRMVALMVVLTATWHRGASAQQSPSTTAITNVSVIPMDTERVLARQTVLIRNGRIAVIGPASQVPVPADAMRIDGNGQFLIPGLADMHVHLFASAELPLYLASGVTTVRNMWGMPIHILMRDSIRTGHLLGPAIYTAGAIVDGDPPQLRGSSALASGAGADSVVAAHLREGYDFIKVYNRLPAEAFAAVVAAATRHGTTVAGHVPNAVALADMLGAGVASIEHLTGYPKATMAIDTGRASWSRELSSARIRSVARETRSSGVWNTPTLLVAERGDMSAAESRAALIDPRLNLLPAMIRRFCCAQAYDSVNDLPGNVLALRRANRFAVVRALHESGARLLLGTDTGNPFVLPGFGVADELGLLVEAGLTPFEALRAGTGDAAEFLGVGASAGTIDVGKQADLVLLGANPLRDIAAVRRVNGVMVRGRWLPASELQKLVQANAAPPPSN